NNHMFTVWDTRSGTEHGSFMVNGGHRHTAFSPDGRYLVATTFARMVVCNVETNQLVGRKHPVTYPTFRFTRDSRKVVTAGDDGIVRVWDLATFNELGTLRGHTEIVYGVGVSADGRTVASGSWD